MWHLQKRVLVLLFWWSSMITAQEIDPNIEDINAPLEVQWVEMADPSIRRQTLQKEDLSQRIHDELVRHYKNLQVPIMETLLFDQLVMAKETMRETDPKELQKSLLREFRHESIRRLSRLQCHKSCGAQVRDGKISLLHCPGDLTVITLKSINQFSCQKVDGLPVFGPVILRNADCNQQLLSLPPCDKSFEHGFIRGGCHHILADLHKRNQVIAVSVLLPISLITMASVLFFVIRFYRMKQDCEAKLNTSGFELTSFISFDAEIGEVCAKTPTRNPKHCQRRTKQLNWVRLFLAIFCFGPMSVKSYDLLDKQVLSENQIKYTIIMESDETIQVGAMRIKFSTPLMESRLSHLFDSYDWGVDTFNKYYCLQSKCDEIIMWKEDMLPFALASNKTKQIFEERSRQYTYASCKHMKAYCTFSNGCYLMGFSLVLKEDKKYEVHSVGRQNKMSTKLELPPGCYLDGHAKSETVGMDGMFYLENKATGGWFCHSNLYSHYPLPHTLGDLKLGKKGEINFVSDFIHCATDSWSNVFCTRPTSFLGAIDDYCIKNEESHIGYKNYNV